MNTSQLNPIPSGILATVMKLVSLTEKEDVEWYHWQHPTNDIVALHNIVEYLKMNCPKINIITGEVLLEGYELAHIILRDDFISPKEMAIGYGFGMKYYTNKQMEHFVNTLPDLQTILWLRTNGYILMPGPSIQKNILQIRKLDNQLFHTKTKGWFTKIDEEFSRKDKVASSEWLAIRKEAAPNSQGYIWNKQQNCITDLEYVPNIAELSYVVTSYRKIRGISLFCGRYVRTSSICLNDNHVIGGDFGMDGIVIYGRPDSTAEGNIGIASARRLG